MIKLKLLSYLNSLLAAALLVRTLATTPFSLRYRRRLLRRTLNEYKLRIHLHPPLCGSFQLARFERTQKAVPNLNKPSNGNKSVFT